MPDRLGFRDDKSPDALMTQHDDSRDDNSDGPFAFKGVQEHLTRLREVYQFIEDGKLVGLNDEQLSQRTGGVISRQQINAMSNGASQNPTALSLEALSKAFGISPIFWFSEAARRRILRRLDARLTGLRNELLFGQPGPGKRPDYDDK